MNCSLDKLLEESEELATKVIDLENGILHADVTAKEIRLIARQLKHMIAYKKVLDQRIKLELK